VPCGQECTWVDLNGNAHDLDFVLERGGSPDKQGAPVAFVETAWRRYTKHSRNKVQEIQGAIEPLAQTYQRSGPFKGAILAGVFTEGALNQLKSLGFTVLYFSYEAVVSVFRLHGIDASFDEETPDAEFRRKIRAYLRLKGPERRKLADALVKSHENEVADFLRCLSAAVSRQIERIIILALHGEAYEALTVEDAIQFIDTYGHDGRAIPLDRYEIEVRYSNGNVISGNFKDKSSALGFLRTYQPVQIASK
jgi:hypothetical protein